MTIALILGGDFFTGSVFAVALTKLVLRFDDKSQDPIASNILRAEVNSVLLKFFFTMLTPFLLLGHANHDVDHLRWSNQVCHGPD
jgi:hypothetical protein